MARVKENIANLASAMNHAVEQNISAEDAPNISTVEVESSPIVNSEQYQGAYAAKAAMSQHMNLVGHAVGSNRVVEIRTQFNPIVEQLKDIRLPDARVNVENKKFDIPFDITHYASTAPQHTAVNLLVEFLGKEKVKQLYIHSRLGGQADKPLLWLVQKIIVETHMDYIYRLGNEIGEDKLKQLEVSLTQEGKDLGDEALKTLLGPQLFNMLKQIAQPNRIATITLFMVIFDFIMTKESKKQTPAAIVTTWDSIADVLKEDEK